MTDTDMIERVARALAHHDGSRISGPGKHKASQEFPWDPEHLYMEFYIAAHWREFVSAAKWVIEAMRTPTEVMRQALRDNLPVDGFEWEYQPDEADKCLTAIIDAALTPVETKP